MGSLALRPGGSLAIHEMALSIGFRILSFLPSCYSSYGALTLPRWDFHPLFMPAFAGRTLPVPYLYLCPDRRRSTRNSESHITDSALCGGLWHSLSYNRQ